MRGHGGQGWNWGYEGDCFFACKIDKINDVFQIKKSIRIFENFTVEMPLPIYLK